LVKNARYAIYGSQSLLSKTKLLKVKVSDCAKECFTKAKKFHALRHICTMQLNLPAFEHKLKEEGGKTFIWDIIRKKFVVLQPEEWVRQHLVHLLVNHLHYPKGLLSVEQGLHYNGISKRADIVVRNHEGGIFLLVEVKAFTVALSEQVLHQIASYHRVLDARYLLISNGLEHFCLDMLADQLNFLEQIPIFER
jgi:hypothetical protein